MTHDPEAAWPLTDTSPGYYPTNPQAMPPAQIVPYGGQPTKNKGISVSQDGTKTPHGTKIAYLAIILGTAIPLTGIAASEMGFFGILISWVGIVVVAAIAFGFSFPKN